MADENTQGTATADTGSQATEERKTTKRTTGDEGEEKTVPYHRFAEMNRAKKDVEDKLAKIEEAQVQAEEEQARKQGEYKTLADRYQTQAQTEKQKRVAAEQALVRYKLMTTWQHVAHEYIDAGAINDAFDMLDPDDLAGLDETDEQKMATLAERLADRKPYLAANSGGGMLGTGSGLGSRERVLGNPHRQSGNSGVEMQPKKVQQIFKKPRRKAWK